MNFSTPLHLALAAAAIALAGCAPFQVNTRLPVQTVASPNIDARKPNYVILHHTGSDSVERALQALTSPLRRVSAHYLIGRDGTIFQLADESARAWHAGQSWWGGQVDINSASIGIELDNNGNEPFAESQISALIALLGDLRERFEIPAANVIAHADVAPARKADPSAYFPWARLAAHGFGLWCDAPLAPAPDGLDLALALTALGYDPANPNAARQAFRLHYLSGGSIVTDDVEKAMAYCLLQKKAAAPRYFPRGSTVPPAE